MAGTSSASPSGAPVDDHAIVRRGLRGLLELVEGMESWARPPTETRRPAGHDDRPDVVLMDLVMPGTDGIAAISAIRAAVGIEIVALTSFIEEAGSWPRSRRAPRYLSRIPTSGRSSTRSATPTRTDALDPRCRGSWPSGFAGPTGQPWSP